MSYLYEHMRQRDSAFYAVVEKSAAKAAPVTVVGEKYKPKIEPKKTGTKSGLPSNLDEGYEALRSGPLREGNQQLKKSASPARIGGLLAALGGAGAGGAWYASQPYQGDEEVSRWSLFRTRRAIDKALDKLKKGKRNLEVETGMHRQAIPMGNINEAALKHLQYEPSIIAIPERGQQQFTSYRRIPDHSNLSFNPHIHKHHKNWFIHSDKHPSLTMAWKHAKTPEERVEAVKRGLQHLVGEGVPGAASYLSNIIVGDPTFEERVDKGMFELISPAEKQVLLNPMGKQGQAMPMPQYNNQVQQQPPQSPQQQPPQGQQPVPMQFPMQQQVPMLQYHTPQMMQQQGQKQPGAKGAGQTSVGPKPIQMTPKMAAMDKIIKTTAKLAPGLSSKPMAASESPQVRQSVLDLLKAKYTLKAESTPVKDSVKLPESVLRDLKRMTDQWVHMTPEEQLRSLSPKVR